MEKAGSWRRQAAGEGGRRCTFDSERQKWIDKSIHCCFNPLVRLPSRTTVSAPWCRTYIYIYGVSQNSVYTGANYLTLLGESVEEAHIREGSAQIKNLYSTWRNTCILSFWGSSISWSEPFKHMGWTKRSKIMPYRCLRHDANQLPLLEYCKYQVHVRKPKTLYTLKVTIEHEFTPTPREISLTNGRHWILYD